MMCSCDEESYIIMHLGLIGGRVCSLVEESLGSWVCVTVVKVTSLYA